MQALGSPRNPLDTEASHRIPTDTDIDMKELKVLKVYDQRTSDKQTKRSNKKAKKTGERAKTFYIPYWASTPVKHSRMGYVPGVSDVSDVDETRNSTSRTQTLIQIEVVRAMRL